jgi:septal ring factor EnvC (AmiA/AmiB activator)
MNVIDNESVKERLLKCAKEHKDLISPLDIEVTKVCNDALERIEELEKENAILSGDSDFCHAEKGEYKDAFIYQVAKTNKLKMAYNKMKELLNKIRTIFWNGQENDKRLALIKDVLTETEKFLDNRGCLDIFCED